MPYAIQVRILYLYIMPSLIKLIGVNTDGKGVRARGGVGSTLFIEGGESSSCIGHVTLPLKAIHKLQTRKKRSKTK